MKTKIFIFLVTLLFLAALTAQEAKKMYIMKDGAITHEVAVSDIDSIVFYNPVVNNDIIGRWLLTKIMTTNANQETEPIDYSERNIIFEFQENNTLIITGNTKEFFISDDFQEGEHYYEYREPRVCPACLPGPSLAIDRTLSGPMAGLYFCFIGLEPWGPSGDKGKMMLNSGNRVIDGVHYGLNYFTKLQ